MRIKDLFDVIFLYLLTIAICVVYTAFFVWLIRRLVLLDGWAFKVVAGAIFLILLVVNFRYYVPDQKAVARGLPIDFERQSLGAIYFGIVIGSMFSTGVIMAFIERFISLVGAPYLVVTGLVFLIVFFGVFVWVKKLRSRS